LQSWSLAYVLSIGDILFFVIRFICSTVGDISGVGGGVVICVYITVQAFAG